MSELKVRLTADGTQALKNLKTLSSTVEDTSKSLAQLAQNANQYEVLTKKLNAAAKGSDEYNRIEKKRAALDEDLVKIQQKYNLVLARKLNSMALSGEQTEVLTRQTKLLKGQMEKLAEVTRDNDFLNKKIELYDIYLGKLNKAKAAEEQARKERAKELEQAKALKELQQDILKARQQYNQVVASAKSEFEATWATAKAQQLAYNTQGQKDFLKSWDTAKSQNVSYLKATALGDNYTIMAQQYSLLDAELTKILSTEGKVTERSQELAKEMNKLKASMDKASKTSLGDRMKNLVKSFVSAQVVVYALQKAVSLVTNTIKEASEAAASAEETANLFNTTFANVATTANNVASKMSSSLGMANSTIQQSLGLFGDLAMGYGESQDSALKFAEAAVQTGLDIMSFKNISGDTTEVLQTMASGLAGNFENFRKWGIIVTQAEIKTRLQQKGLDKLTGSSLQFAKVQETLAIVQEKSKNAVGDMKDTLESTENTVRRFNEANKELLENLGQSVNPVLNTLRNIWIDIATQINKAAKAEEEFAKGGYVTGVYDTKNNEKDDKAFRQAIGENAFGTISSFFGLRTDIFNIDNYAKTVSDAMILFDASVEETIDKVRQEVNISSDNLNKLIEVLNQKDTERQQWTEAQKAVEQRRLTIESNASSVSGFAGTIGNIPGVSFKNNMNYAASAMNYVGPVYYEDEEYFNKAQSELTNIYANIINDAIDSLTSADWTEFTDAIGVALGDVTEASGLEEKLNSIYSLYESVYNLRLEDGKLTEEEKAELQQIADLYAGIKSRIEEINEIKSVQSKLESFAVSNESLQITINELGMSDLEKSIAAATREFEALDLSILSDEEIAYATELYNARIELLKQQDEKEKMLKAQQEAEEKLAEAEKEYANTLEDLKSRLLDYRISNAILGMTDEQAEIYKLEQERETALAGVGTDTDKARDIVNYFREMIKLVKDKYQFERTQVFSESVKEFNSYLTSLQGDTGYTSYKQLSDESKFYEKLDEYFKEQQIADKDRKTYYYKFLDVLKEQKINEAKATINSGLGESLELYKGFDTLFSGGGFGDLLSTLASLVTQTELFAKASSILSDTVLPVMNAFLQPTVDLLSVLSESIQTLLVDVLDPFFALFKTVTDMASGLLESITGVLSSLISNALSPIETILDTITEALVPVMSILNAFIELLSPLFEMLQIITAILNPLIETVLKPIANTIKWISELVITGFTYVEVFLKKFVGNIVGFFQGAWNSVVSVLRSIDILGWRPFGGLNYADTTLADTWTKLDYQEEIQKKLDEMNKTIEGIAGTNLEIADNTSNKNEEALKTIEDLYSRGVLTASQRDAEVASLAGNKYDVTKLFAGGAYRSTGYQTTVSYGDMTFIINTDSMSGDDVKELAKEVIRQLDEKARPGSNTLAS